MPRGEASASPAPERPPHPEVSPPPPPAPPPPSARLRLRARRRCLVGPIVHHRQIPALVDTSSSCAAPPAACAPASCVRVCQLGLQIGLTSCASPRTCSSSVRTSTASAWRHGKQLSHGPGVRRPSLQPAPPSRAADSSARGAASSTDARPPPHGWRRRSPPRRRALAARTAARRSAAAAVVTAPSRPVLVPASAPPLRARPTCRPPRERFQRGIRRQQQQPLRVKLCEVLRGTRLERGSCPPPPPPRPRERPVQLELRHASLSIVALARASASHPPHASPQTTSPRHLA